MKVYYKAQFPTNRTLWFYYHDSTSETGIQWLRKMPPICNESEVTVSLPRWYLLRESE